MAALLIVCSHIYSVTGYPYIALNWVATTLDCLYSGIPLFFVLSGFCLYYPLTKPGYKVDWPRFFRRRIQRLIPPYYITIAAITLLPFLIEPVAGSLGMVVTVPDLPPWPQIALHLLLIHTLSTNAFYFYGLDSTFWTLPIEWQFYVVFPFAAWLVHRWRWRGAVAICAATLGYRILLFATPLATTQWPIDVADLFLSRWSSFALGMLVAQRLRHAQHTSLSAIQELVEVLGAIVLFLLAAFFMYGPARQWPYQPRDVLFGGFYSVILYVSCVPGSRCGRVLASPILVWLGMISYSLYLLHYPILYAIAPTILALHLDPVTNIALVTTVCVPVAIAAAAVFFQLVERHFLNLPQTPSPQSLRRSL